MPEDTRSELQLSPTYLYKKAKYNGVIEINKLQPAVEEVIQRVIDIESPDLKWQILRFLPLPSWRSGKNFILNGKVYHRAPGWINPKIDQCYQKQQPYYTRKLRPGEPSRWGPIKQN